MRFHNGKLHKNNLVTLLLKYVLFLIKIINDLNKINIKDKRSIPAPHYAFYVMSCRDFYAKTFHVTTFYVMSSFHLTNNYIKYVFLIIIKFVWRCTSWHFTSRLCMEWCYVMTICIKIFHAKIFMSQYFMSCLSCYFSN